MHAVPPELFFNRTGYGSRRVFLLLGAAAGTAGAESVLRDGRGGRFEDDLLSNLEGEWVLKRQIAGRDVENTASVTWVLQHQFLLLRMRDVATPSKYEADVYLGYSYQAKQYVAHWIDNFGGRFSAVGRGVRRGNSVEFRFEYPDGPFYNTFTWDPVSRSWHCHLESVGVNGTRSTFARDTLVPRR